VIALQHLLHMKLMCTLLVLLAIIYNACAQTTQPNQTLFIIKKSATVNFDSISNNYIPGLIVKEMPKQGATKAEVYNYPKIQEKQATSKQIKPISKKSTKKH
jgi:hypothetical protein